MPRAKKRATAKKSKIKYWSAAELKQLKSLAGRANLAQLARRLNRTTMAVRRKATQKGISLALKRR